MVQRHPEASEKVSTPRPVTNLAEDMQALRATLTADQRESFDAGRRHIRLERWTDLEHTDVWVAHFDAGTKLLDVERATRPANPEKIKRLERGVASLAAKVADCLERDMEAASRPEGCWCFGLGGRTRTVMAVAANLRVTREGDVVGDSPMTQANYQQEPEYVWATCCPYCTEGHEAAARKREIASALMQQRQTMPASGWQSAIPARMQGWRLTTSPLLQVEGMIGILHQITGVAPNSYCFHGSVRVGKTGLCVALAWDWRESRQTPTVLFWTVPELLQAFRNDYNRRKDDERTPTEGEIIRAATDAHLLILDDLCAEAVAQSGEIWRQERLYQIVNTRLNANRPTLFTSNKDETEMLAVLGPRVYWRIFEGCGNGERIIHVFGPNQSAQRA